MTGTEQIKAVLFDMDGLLFDSEIVGKRVIQEIGREIGVDIKTEHINMTLGITLEGSRKIYARYYPQVNYDLLRQEFVIRMRRLAENKQMPLKKGAVNLLKKLKEKKILCAVASSSPIKIVETYLDSQNIREYFDLLQSGTELTHSKPHPEIFLTAAKKLAVPIENCVVLEDSINGIRAGRASGAKTIMIPDQIPYDDSLQPFVDAVLPDLDQVIPFLSL